MTQAEVARVLEVFVRETFGVAPGDTRFHTGTALFDRGYVDSLGVTDLLHFIHERFHVEIPDSDLISDQFSTIDGIAGLVARHASHQDPPGSELKPPFAIES